MSATRKVSPTWTRLDLDIITHTRIQQLVSQPDGFRGFHLYIEGICWSAKNLSDGLLPDWWRPSTPNPRKAAVPLVGVGLWIEVEEAMRYGLPGDDDPPLANARWLINDYLDYGISREEWAALVDQRKAAAAARWAKRGGKLKGIR